MSLEKHVEMLHDHINKQQESQKRLMETFSTNQKRLLEENIKLQHELEHMHGLVDALQEKLRAPLTQAWHKLTRRGHYAKPKLLK